MTERICHPLVADDLVIGQASTEAAVKAAIEAERKRIADAKPKQADVERAVKGVKAAGVPVSKVEVSRDKITVEVGKADDDGMARDASVIAMDRIAAMPGGRK